MGYAVSYKTSKAVLKWKWF